jgi:PAS domain S-box-containing protein/putative nucleotidyltransferase with HDIG domain
VPVLDADGTVAGLVSAGLDLAWFNQLAAQMDLPPGALAMLSDRDGRVLALFPDSEQSLGQPTAEGRLFQASALNPNGSALIATGSDGVQRLYGFVPLPGMPVPPAVVSVGLPTAVAYADSHRILFFYIPLLIIFSLVALLASTLAGEALILRPARALVRATERLAEGDLTARAGPLSGRTELSQLAEAFDRMAGRVEERVAERSRAAQVLRESEARYRLLAETAQDLIFVIGPDDRITYANSVAARQWGRQPADIVGRQRADLFPPAIAEAQRQILDQIQTSGEPAYTESRVQFGEREAWLANWLVPMKDEAGSVQAVLGVSRDITQRRQWEQSLRESEARYRVLFEANPHPMWVYDLETLAFLTVNDAAVRHYGYSRDEFLGMTIADIRPPEDVPALLNKVARVIPGIDESGLWRHCKRDGTVIDVEITTHTLEFAGHRAKLVLAHDVTAQHRAEADVQRQVQRLGALRQIDSAISGSLDLRVTLEVFLAQTLSQLQVHAADVLLFNRPLNLLEFAAGRGFRTSAMQRTRLRLGEGFAGRAALERRIVAIPDLRAAVEDPAPGGHIELNAAAAGEEFVAYYGVPLVAKGAVTGVLEIFHRAALAPDAEWLEFLETLAGQAAIAIEDAALFESLQRSNVNLTLAYDATIEGWSRALELRDSDTEGHTLRVTDFTLRLARAAGLADADLVHLRRGALLHDIGKMGIPDEILRKPGPLSEAEWAVMRQHPRHAYEMLSPIAYLRLALDIPYCHHEKWDGTGYPRGLKGEQIPLAARLFAVVDVWDALRSDRPYRAAWPETQVRAHLRALAGVHFDPQAVELFWNVVDS